MAERVETGCRPFLVGCWSLAVGCWSAVAGCWLLVTGGGLLAAGWLLRRSIAVDREKVSAHPPGG